MRRESKQGGGDLKGAGVRRGMEGGGGGGGGGGEGGGGVVDKKYTDPGGHPPSGKNRNVSSFIFHLSSNFLLSSNLV